MLLLLIVSAVVEIRIIASFRVFAREKLTDKNCVKVEYIILISLFFRISAWNFCFEKFKERPQIFHISYMKIIKYKIKPNLLF